MAENQRCPDCEAEHKLREQWQSNHEHVHRLEKESLDIARKEIDRRLEGMNELRAQLTTERGEYVRRDLYDREHASLRDSLEVRLRFLENASNNTQGRFTGVGTVWAILVAIGAFVIALLNLLARIKG